MVSTIEEALAWMDAQKTAVHRVSLDKITTALALVNNPHLNLKTIHIAGTNGKGSVTAYLRNILMAHGLTVGSFTSPHLMRFNERITFNGIEIDDATVVRLVNRLIEVNDYMVTTQYSRLVFFELYTVMMFMYFQEIQPDICLIEVGLGGLHDCTNVIDSKDIIITTIGLDHVEKLGATFAEIAAQKAGIISEKADVFIGELPSTATQTIAEISQTHQATLYQLGHDMHYQIISQSLTLGSSFTIDTQTEPYHIKMIGQHQIHNAALALQFFYHWAQKYAVPVDEKAVRTALSHTQWNGRMEQVNREPLIFIDGAHNEAGIKALAQTIETYLQGQSVKIIYSGLVTKNQIEHLKLLLAMPIAELVITEFNHYNAMPLAEFATLIPEQNIQNIPIRMTKEWQNELMNHQYDVTIVTGSLYFISEVRTYLLSK